MAEKANQRPALSAKSNEPRRQLSEDDILDKTASQAGWQYLAERLRRYDEDKVKGCKEDIDTLLVFAGLFGAVITAFIIESYKQLQPDPNATTVFLLAQIVRQLNSSLVDNDLLDTFNPEPVKATSVQINILWFCSLLLSVMAASACIIVKGWFREYLSATENVPAKEYCYRHYGLIKYYVYEMADNLPLLLQVALVLFCAGLILFIHSLNDVVGWVCTALIVVSVAIYVSSIAISIFDPHCPFKVPYLLHVYKHLIFACIFVARVFRVLSRYLYDLYKRVIGTSTEPVTVQIPQWRELYEGVEKGSRVYQQHLGVALTYPGMDGPSLVAAYTTLMNTEFLPYIADCIRTFDSLHEAKKCIKQLEDIGKWVGFSSRDWAPFCQALIDILHRKFENKGGIPQSQKDIRTFKWAVRFIFQKCSLKGLRFHDLFNKVLVDAEHLVDDSIMRHILSQPSSQVTHLRNQASLDAIKPLRGQAIKTIMNNTGSRLDSYRTISSGWLATYLFLALHSEEQAHLDAIKSHLAEIAAEPLKVSAESQHDAHHQHLMTVKHCVVLLEDLRRKHPDADIGGEILERLKELDS
ncbi:hypothetical protein K474DRAFT_72831 [Panus rudis PR-1116 ss-1]|nr:hypothetical protein K474DRAFT_72831 [Panus rudis PR-1116 ss-1]